jgi:DNA topoisomerase-6 subunit B
LDGDLGVLKIKKIEKISYNKKFVYDVSVPHRENFVAGFGPIFCHNSLDACDDAGILPEIFVSVKQIGADRFKVAIEDNGPGIVEEKVPLAFGKLLFGSKFHRLRQSRGIMGVGISGSILYSQLTTGKPVKITSSTGKEIHIFELAIDVSKNEPKVISHEKKKNPEKWHGIKIEMEVEGRYVEKAQSIPEYLKQTAISNPHARIVYDGPNGKIEFERTVKEVPARPKEIKPHPYGVELGILRRMLIATKAKNILGFLTSDFSRVGRRSAEQICRLAKIEFSRNPKGLTSEESERLHKAMQMVKLIAPPTGCLSPLEENLILEGLKKEINAEHYVATVRPPSVYRGFPFQVSVGLAYGGNLPPNQTCQLIRFANKVPLLYHQSDCAITEAVIETDWRRYGLSQSQGQLPIGPLAILVHFASVWVPFTTEGKQAISAYPEIVKEVKLALQDAGRKLAKYISQKRKYRERFLRRQLFERYIPIVAESLSKLTRKEKREILNKLEEFIKKKLEVKKIEGSEEKA